MAQKLGKLFVFEGPDGAGKTTLATNLAGRLKADEIDCDVMSFPGQEGGTLGRHIYQLHHDPARFEIASIRPASLQVLHIAAHIEAIEGSILPSLKSGRSVILDRFWWSAWVYGLVDGVDTRFLNAMVNLELLIWKGVLPTAVFLITSGARLNDDTSPGRRERLREAYLELAAGEQGKHTVYRVENDKPLNESVEHVHRLMAGMIET